MSQNNINHVAFVLDRSGSMQGRERDLIKVVDNQVKLLADLSQSTGQETRVTVYVFDDKVECVIFDKDVLRLPSIASLYRIGGRTALIDATILSQEDLALTMRKYGDHAFLTYVFTDGYENESRSSVVQLRNLFASQGPEWTTGIFVPDITSKSAAQSFGFPVGNIAIWNVNAATGIEEVGSEIQASTQSYFNLRASGQSGTKQLFATDPSTVNAATIKAAGLKPLNANAYSLVPVPKPRDPHGVLNKDKHRVWEISSFVRHATGTFTVGAVFYQLSKKEKIQGNKKLAILDNKTSKVYVGDGVRAMVGLPDGDMSVAPDHNPDYTIFVQSTSINRHLVVGTKVLVLK